MSKTNTTFDRPDIVCKFMEQIRKRDFDFRDDRVSTVMDFLYVAYTENKGRDPEPIYQAFQRLGVHLEKLPIQENDAIFNVVVDLCDLFEQRAFKDALQLGAYLILELRGE